MLSDSVGSWGLVEVVVGFGNHQVVRSSVMGREGVSPCVPRPGGQACVLHLILHTFRLAGLHDSDRIAKAPLLHERVPTAMRGTPVGAGLHRWRPMARRVVRTTHRTADCQADLFDRRASGDLLDLDGGRREGHIHRTRKCELKDGRRRSDFDQDSV